MENFAIMGKIVINSDLSLVKAIKQIKEDYKSYKWVQITINGGTRTLKQNAWIYKAYTMLSLQGDQTFLEYKAYCKHKLGLSILDETHPERVAILRQMYKSVSYENWLKFMIDEPVTSLFNLDQGKQYIEEMIAHYSGFEMPGKEDIK